MQKEECQRLKTNFRKVADLEALIRYMLYRNRDQSYYNSRQPSWSRGTPVDYKRSSAIETFMLHESYPSTQVMLHENRVTRGLNKYYTLFTSQGLSINFQSSAQGLIKQTKTCKMRVYTAVATAILQPVLRWLGDRVRDRKKKERGGCVCVNRFINIKKGVGTKGVTV